MAVDIGAVERNSYPVRLSMSYPEKLSRLSTLVRLILAIPIFVFLSMVSSGYIVVAIWLAVLVKGRIPRWLFNFQVAVHRFTYRGYAYAGLLTDEYPAFEGEWLLNYDVDYPDRISRWRLLFWKLITALPHLFVLFFLGIASFFVIFISWWAILFTGEFPRGLHKFVVGVVRWGARVTAYVESLTDVFPPFSLDEDAGPGSPSSLVLSAVLGGLMFVGIVGGGAGIAALAYVVSHESKTVHVRYDAVTSGAVSASETAAEMDNVAFALQSAEDPATVDVFKARTGYHIVRFVVSYDNARQFRPASGYDVELDTLRLETETGTASPVLLTVNDVTAPIDVTHGLGLTLRAYFEVKNGDTPLELRAYPLTTSSRRVIWDFR